MSFSVLKYESHTTERSNDAIFINENAYFGNDKVVCLNVAFDGGESRRHERQGGNVSLFKS